MQHGCGSGSAACSCSGGAMPARASHAAGADEAGVERGDAAGDRAVARVNGIALHASDDWPDDASLRQRAYGELLRQEAIRQELLDERDIAGDAGAQSEAATTAIETLLEQKLVVPQPDDVTCQRYFEQNGNRFRAGERVELRHILFAVTPGVDVVQLRRRAEAALLDARCRADDGEDRFPVLARELSNCPTGAEGGYLGWLQSQDCAPEFAREVFEQTEIGVLPRLVHSRFGLHVVQILARQPGTRLSFETARGAVMQLLQQQSYVTAVRQYLQLLAASADVQGIDLAAADSPLVQ